MNFEWDDLKNEINIRKHGIDFKDATEISYPMLVALDSRESYGEDRWIGIGWLKQIICVVVFIEYGQDTIRIVSTRKATKREVCLYEQRIKN